MKFNKISMILPVVAALAVTGCESYEIDMPANPAEPTVGPEVSTSVIYEANPRFFGTSGCLNEIDLQLPRIQEMGCDILWVMPVFEPGSLNSIGSPYCIRDFKAVNPSYGTLDDLKKLVGDAHSKGMKVMLDWIANHTSWDNPWITTNPDRYVHDENGNIVSPSGWSDVAQLDFTNASTREAMKDAMVYWVKECGIDGYRCDYADGVPLDFWSDLIVTLRGINPEFIMLAETNNASFYEAGFDMIYDWSSSTAIADAFTGGKPSGVITEAADALARVPEGDSILRYVLNHDVAAENNVATMFGSYDAVPAAYVLASMLNGTPMIYSAMDVANLSGKLSFFNFNKLTFSDELTATYKAINSAFKASAEVRRGQLTDYSGSSIVCFTRSIPGHNLLVAVNTSASAQSLKSPITLAGATMNDLLNGGQATVPVTIELQPYSYIILAD